jgi:hypothetical protein
MKHLFISLISGFLLLLACSRWCHVDPEQEYVLRVAASGAGTIAISPGDSIYPEGAVVILTATADSGYVFTGWNGTFQTTANP